MPRRFHPGYSLLGRWIRARVRDERMAEGAFILACCALLLMLAVAQNLAWAVFLPALTTPAALSVFWAAQLTALLLFVGVGLVGFRPGFTVRCDAHQLEVDRAGEALVIPRARILRVAEIPYLAYYRHYRAYARTRAFLGAAVEQVLLIETPEGPVILALPADERAALRALLERSPRDAVPAVAPAALV
ncbi:MAG: hypothetical protein R2834_06300 [Rhodothermales bacterium]